MSKRTALSRQSGHRRFGSVRIFTDGRIRFSAWTIPDVLELQFITSYRTIGVDLAGKVTVKPDRFDTYPVTVQWLDRDILTLSVVKRRVTDAVFPYFLTPDELRHAVSVLRRVGNGLDRWITPGLLFLQKTLRGMVPDPDREALKPVVEKLLRSTRSIPLPRPWVQMQRENERQRQKALKRWGP